MGTTKDKLFFYFFYLAFRGQLRSTLPGLTSTTDIIPVAVALSLNTEEVDERDNISSNNKLGIPLPSGVVRVYKEDITSTSSGIDSHQQMIFIGEDSINHIPRNENMTLQIGNAFDIVGQTTLVSETNPF